MFAVLLVRKICSDTGTLDRASLGWKQRQWTKFAASKCNRITSRTADQLRQQVVSTCCRCWSTAASLSCPCSLWWGHGDRPATIMTPSYYLLQDGVDTMADKATVLHDVTSNCICDLDWQTSTISVTCHWMYCELSSYEPLCIVALHG